MSGEHSATLTALLSGAALGVGLLGGAILVVGVLRSLSTLLLLELGRAADPDATRTRLRHQLGHYLLLGLEFLVAADVLETILTPSVEHVLLLAGVVLIRTVIAFSVHWELGRENAGHARAPVAVPSPTAADSTALPGI